jgi:8-oxo-dGTP pyrophosphatase MutT (NUDIX family)
MAHFDVAMVALRQGEYFLMQERNERDNVGAIGLIGFFGGKIHEGEEPREAACRELKEETSVTIAPSDLSFIGEVKITMDHPAGKDTTVKAQVFETNIGNINVEAKEGTLVRFTQTEAGANLEKLTPATKSAFIELLGAKSNGT